MNNKIISIHYLRGIAALLVVFFHFRFYLNNVYAQHDLGTLLFGGGAFGVDLFFMISGFIIAMSTNKTNSPFIFVIRRFFRIYPAFILTFLIGAYFVYYNMPIDSIVRSMFFIHKDYSLESPSFGYNILGPAWTLTYEFYFYFTFVIAMSISHSYRILISSILITVPMLVIHLFFSGRIDISGGGSPLIPDETICYSLIRFLGSPIMLEFIIGMIAYEIFLRFPADKKHLTFPKVIFYISLGIFSFFYFQNNYYGFGLQGFGLWSVILMTGFLIHEKYSTTKVNKTLSFLGDISYSLYLTHYVIINALDLYKPLFWINSHGISKFLLATTICLLAAYLTFNFVERPFIRIGKSIEEKTKSMLTASDN
ncbi:acyltransferase [Escherichia coli]|nr:acyltransferase [Escherichia coli]EJA4557020.1 acyltransferase [Escherichia coli]